MRIGVAREIKPQEGRVALLPEQVATLVGDGHAVLVERGAGLASGAADEAYAAAGATLAEGPEALWAGAELIAKVKEILPAEYDLLERRHIVFTNLHTALNRPLTDRLLEVGLTGLSAEEMHRYGTPNSPLAGEVGALEGLRLCFAPYGGSGRHFVGHYGSEPVTAVVIGLGGAGLGAARVLCRLGCRVVGLDADPGARYRAGLSLADQGFDCRDVAALPDLLPRADLIVNCVRWDKTRGDHLLARADLARLPRGAVICDISCDEAGAIETSRPTSWAEPTYHVDGVLHFAVDNIPGAVPVAASAGYARAILPFLRAIGAHGVLEACRRDTWLARGLTCLDGTLVLEETGRCQGRPFTPLGEVLVDEAARTPS